MDKLLEIIGADELYVLMRNGVIVSSNLEIKKLHLDKNISFVLVHQIDEDCNIDIDIEENCSVKITEIFYSSRKVKVNKNINMKQKSNLNIVTLEHNNGDEIEINAKTTLEKNSYINSMKLIIYLGKANEIENVEINGEKSHLENYNVYINCSNDSQTIEGNITHIAKDSESKLTNYGICRGTSKLNINTNGIIKKDAKGTNIVQKSTGILVDKDSIISANPWLQIDEFDCLASHGAGIGAIDEEELYYLMSRGLSRTDSEKLIIGGYVNPIYENIENAGLKKLVMEVTNKYL